NESVSRCIVHGQAAIAGNPDEAERIFVYIADDVRIETPRIPSERWITWGGTTKNARSSRRNVSRDSGGIVRTSSRRYRPAAQSERSAHPGHPVPVLDDR